MRDRRELTPMTDQSPTPGKIEYAVFRPKDPKDRGDIEFICPTCRQVLLNEMSEHYSRSAPPVWCDRCKVWLSPGGSSVDGTGS